MHKFNPVLHIKPILKVLFTALMLQTGCANDAGGLDDVIDSDTRSIGITDTNPIGITDTSNTVDTNRSTDNLPGTDDTATSIPDIDTAYDSETCGQLITDINNTISQKFHLNHLGFDKAGPKLAVVESSGQRDDFKLSTPQTMWWHVAIYNQLRAFRRGVADLNSTPPTSVISQLPERTAWL